MTRKYSEKILNTLAILAPNEQVDMVAADGMLINLHLKQPRRFPHNRYNYFFVFEEAPPANRLMRFESNMVSLLELERTKSPSLINSERATVSFFNSWCFWQKRQLFIHVEILLQNENRAVPSIKS